MDYFIKNVPPDRLDLHRRQDWLLSKNPVSLVGHKTQWEWRGRVVKGLRLSQHHMCLLFLTIVTTVIFTGCVGTSTWSPEIEIQRTLDDFLILETQHIYFLTADWTFADIEPIANRVYADVVIIHGKSKTSKELLELYLESWLEWEQIDGQEKADLRSQFEDNEYIMEFREQEIFVSTAKNRAIVQGTLYSGLLLPSGEPVEEMLIPFCIELRRVNETWKITEVTELQH